MTVGFIAEMGWKSAAISGVALLALVLLRSRSAADRAALVRLALVLLLLLPIISLAFPALEVERPADPIEAAPVAVARSIDAEPAVAARPVVVAVPATSTAPDFELPTALLLTLGYLTGVVLLVVRLVVGLATLRRWTLEAAPITSPAWTAALRRVAARAGVDAPVRLLASDDVASPLSWGVRHPVILVDHATLDRPADAEAVLAHELAHVRRHDWPMLMLSRVAVALFWFNPLVWLLERALVEQAEEAADLAAVGGIEPVSYVRTLVACGAQAGGLMLPANSIADGGGLARRVRVVLDEERRRLPSGSTWTRMTMLLCAAISAPIAALELVPPTPPAAPTAPRSPIVAVAPLAPTAPAAPTAPSPAAAPVAPAVPDLAEVEAAVERAAENGAARVAAAAPAIAEAGATAQARAAVRAAAAVAAIDVDDLIAMKAHGVDENYLAEVATLAPRLRLSVDELVQMKIHGLTPMRMREFAELGYADPDDLVTLQIQGVSPAYARALAAAGYRGLSADELVTMRIHGVTAEQARRARLGDRRPSADELVEMRIHGLL